MGRSKPMSDKDESKPKSDTKKKPEQGVAKPVGKTFKRRGTEKKG